MAELEHASVAAFARFTLELLSLAAPAGLVSSATRAIAEETEHARLCYALASAYGGHAIGPGALDVSGALASLDPVSVVTRTVIEGCVGETLAGLEAGEAAQHASDPVVRDILFRIAEDEARHAELAWQFVAWAVASDPARLSPVVARTLATLEGEMLTEDAAQASSADVAPEDLLSAGLMPAALRRELHQRAWREVLWPCASELLGLVSHRLIGSKARSATPLCCSGSTIRGCQRS